MIEADLRENCWEPGHVIGTLGDLVARYQVGLSSVRQAVLLLERQGRLELKRGQGGGVAVGMSGAAAAAMSMSTFLEFLPIEADELFDARACVEGLSAKLAAERGDRQKIPLLYDREVPPVGDDEAIRLHRSATATRFGTLLASLSNNPLLEIFAEVLRHMSLEVIAGSRRPQEFDQAAAGAEKYRLALADAVMAGDADRAGGIAHQFFTAEFPLLMRPALIAARRGQTALGRDGLDKEMEVRWVLYGRQIKTAEALIRLLLREVRTRGLGPGARIGSEPEILERYRVARPVLREAVRMLERHGILNSRVGKAGGVYVGVAAPEATVEFLESEMRGLAIRPEHIAELRLRIEPELARQAAAQVAFPESDTPASSLVEAGRRSNLHILPLFVQALRTLSPPTVADSAELLAHIAQQNVPQAFRAARDQLLAEQAPD